MPTKKKLPEIKVSEKPQFSKIYAHFLKETHSPLVDCAFEIEMIGAHKRFHLTSLILNNFPNAFEFKLHLRLILKEAYDALKLSLTSFSLGDSIFIIQDFVDELDKCKSNYVGKGPKVSVYRGFGTEVPYLPTLILKEAQFNFKDDDYYDDKFEASCYAINEYAVSLQDLLEESKEILKTLSDNLKGQMRLFDSNFILSSSAKLKTTLTVPQLAFLFKALNKLEIFQYTHKNEIYNFLAKNIQTMKSSELSVNTIKNFFESSKEEVAEFWFEKFEFLTKWADLQKSKMRDK